MVRRQERAGVSPLTRHHARKAQRAHRVRLTAILRQLCLACVVMTTIALPGTARADLDPAVREAVAAAAVKLAALVTVREGRTTTEEVWPLGSATVVSPDGVLLTNYHVVELSNLQARLAQEEDAAKRQGRDRRLQLLEGRVVVLVTEGAELRRAYIADVLVTDPVLDLAVLRITAGAHGEPLRRTLQLPYVPLGDSDTLRIGDLIHVFGYPATAGGTLKYTQGRVSGFDVEPGVLGWAWIDSDATVSGGSSGGTAVNDTGQLIGIPTLATELDCRPGDTNGDGVIDEGDVGCIPIGDSFLRMRPVNLAKPLLLQVSSFFAATPAPTSGPAVSPAAPAASPTPATATATPAGSPGPGDDSAAAFLAWRETALRRPSLTGPLRGSMLQVANQVAGINAGVRVQDFYARARVTPPAGDTARLWDAGFMFRHTGPGERFRWVILMNGLEVIDSGPLPGGSIVPAGPVTLELAVIADTALFAVNDTFVASANVAARTSPGDVVVGAAFLAETNRAGERTTYDSFEVWTLDPPSSEPTPTPNPTLPRGPVVLRDDFSDPAQGALPNESRNPNRYRAGYDQGEYVLGALAGDISEQFPIWLPGTYRDAAIEFDVRMTEASDSAYIIAGCRSTGSPPRGYVLVLDPIRGYAWLDRIDGLTKTTLAPQQPFAAIRFGHATNRLYLSCTGSTITAAINGAVLASVTDSTYGEGQFSIGGGIYIGLTGTYELRFDNLTVWDTASAVPTATPAPTQTPTPTAAPTPTPTPAPDDAATLSTLKKRARENSSIAGPLKGKLEQQEGTIVYTPAEVSVRDFYVRARFTNPRDSAETPWDYGLGFRDDGQGTFYMLVVTSEGTYHLYLKRTDYETIAEGVVPGMLLAASERNELGLVVVGPVAYFEVNGQYVATLDLLDRLDPGRIWVGTGFFADHTLPGDRVAYDRFEVWSLDPGVSGDAAQFARMRDGALAGASLAGPFSGSVEQRVGELDGFFAGVMTQDFYVRAEFINPFPASEHIWDIGVAFRHTGPNQQLRLIIRSDGMWFATDGADAPYASGLATGLRTGANESNVVELIAAGDEGYLTINGRFVARLDLSMRETAGDIWLGSGFFADDVVTGATTSFTGFQVWPLAG